MLSFKKNRNNLNPDSVPQEHHPESDSNLEEHEEITAAPSVDDVEAGTEDTEVSIPVLSVPDPFFNLQDHIAYFGYSQRGKSHISSEAPCQDRCSSAYLPELGYLILAVADGVGSCALSDLGADTAVNSVVDYLKKELQKPNAAKLNSHTAGSILRSAMQFAYEQVEQVAVTFEQLLYSLQSTLTVVIYDGSNLYFAHAGDDGIVALTEDGILAMATNRHKGEDASSVYPLQEKSTWEFGMVPNTVAFVLATDGVLDAFVSNSFEKNRVYYPFVEPIFTAKYQTAQDVGQMCKDFYTYMDSEKYRSAVTDDLTITVALNTKKVSRCLPKFDMDAWNEETKKYSEMRRNALYNHKPQKQEPQESVETNNPPEPAPQQQAAPAPNPLQNDDKRASFCSQAWEQYCQWLAGIKKEMDNRKKKRRDPYEPHLDSRRRTPSSTSKAGQENAPPRMPAPAPRRSRRRRKWSPVRIAIVVIVAMIFFLGILGLFRLARLFVSLLLSFL